MHTDIHRINIHTDMHTDIHTYSTWTTFCFITQASQRIQRISHMCLSYKNVHKMSPNQHTYWHAHRHTHLQHMEDLLLYHTSKSHPLSLILFPEGTDLSKENLAKSNAYASQQGLPKYKHVLHPKVIAQLWLSLWYICMYVCMCVCVYIFIYIWTLQRATHTLASRAFPSINMCYIPRSLWYIHTYVCIYACVCIYIHMNLAKSYATGLLKYKHVLHPKVIAQLWLSLWYICIYIRTCTCMFSICICMYVCVCLYIYIYIYIYMDVWMLHTKVIPNSGLHHNM